MSDLNLTSFNPLYPMRIHPYKELLNDSNVNIMDKVNAVIDYLNQVGKLTNDVVKDWNTVYQWVMNDGLTTDVNNKLEAMLANHEFDPIMNNILTKIGDLTTLQTVDKDTLVHAINDLVTEIGSLSSLQTSDKSSIVNAINANVASLAQKAQQGYTKNYIFNHDVLSGVRGRFFRSMILGDSIGKGDGSTGSGLNIGFLQLLEYAMQNKQNFINSYFINLYDFASAYTWLQTQTGIGADVISTQAGSTAYDIFLGNTPPQVAYTARIYYSKRSDGGTGNITDGSGNVLGTINYNGTSQDGLTQDISVTAGNRVKISPPASGNAYINGVRIILNTGININSEYYIENWSRHGRKSTDLTNAQIDSMFNYSSEFNLFVYELITNDYNAGTLSSYQTATDYILSEAKSKGMAVLIVIPCGMNTTVGSATYKSFKDYLYQTATTNGYAILDFDNYFGGYNGLNRVNGFTSDGVHPNDYGYSLMARVISQLLLETDSNYVYRDNPSHVAYGVKYDKDKHYYSNNVMFDNLGIQAFNSGGWAYQYLPPMPIINGTGVSSFPKYAPIGMMATVNGSSVYVNSTDWGTNKNTPATWNALALTLPKVTSLPTANAQNRGQMVLFDNNGSSNDIIYVCIAVTGGTQAWIALNPSTLSIPIVNSLPTANAQNRGQMFLLNNNGSSNDGVYICIAVTGGTQAWKQVTLT